MAINYQCLELDIDDLPTDETVTEGSTCLVLDTKKVLAYHDGVWYEVYTCKFPIIIKRTFLYYELATEVTKSVDGNEIIANVEKKLPNAPSTDGTYTLKVTVSSCVPTYSWVSDSASGLKNWEEEVNPDGTVDV